MGKKQLVLVLAEPTLDQESEFNDYYDNLHLDEVLATTGWRSAQRFKYVDAAGDGCPLPYLAAYEVDAEDSAEVIKTLNDTRPQRAQSGSINKRSARVWVFEAIGPQHTNHS